MSGDENSAKTASKRPDQWSKVKEQLSQELPQPQPQQSPQPNNGLKNNNNNQNTTGHNYQSSWLVYLATLCAQMSSIAMGCTFGWSGPALEDMATWNATRYRPDPNTSEAEWIASVLNFGALAGAAVCGLLMDGLGRQRTLAAVGVPYVIGWLVMGVAPGFWLLLIGRIITGVALGVTTAVLPTYVTEISTPNNRGVLGMAFNFFICIGMCFMATVFCLGAHWHQIALWALLPSALLSLSMLFMPESPSWCVNRIADPAVARARALASLRLLRTATSDIDAELAELLDCAHRQSADERNQRISILSTATYTRPDVYKPVLIGMLLLFFQQFTGINAVSFYLNDIFSRSNAAVSPRVSGLIANAVMLAATVVGGLIIDRFGRRILWSAIGMMISIAVLGNYKYEHRNDDEESAMVSELSVSTTTLAVTAISTQTTDGTAISTTQDGGSTLPILAICTFLAAFSMGVGPICWILVTEITPPQTLGLVSSTTSAFAWLFAFVVVNYTASLTALVHEYGTYWFFAAVAAVSAVFIYALPETRGRRLEEILVLFGFELRMRSRN